MKKIFTIMLTVAMLASISLNALAEPGLSNFTSSDTYIVGQFNDVNAEDWFAPYVETAYNCGFVQGKGGGVFDPGGLLTLGEAVTLAARLRSIYYTGSADFPVSEPFYSAYTDYALENGILDGHGDYGAFATRAEFAQLIYNALPADVFPGINTIPDYGICDVGYGADFYEAVYTLYRAGILAGSDRYGTFFPNSNITRAETCAVVARLADLDTRQKVSLPVNMPAEVIYQRSAGAVFTLETFDSNGTYVRSGSGFFISDTGLAVTALHVFDFAASAKILLNDGREYSVRGICALSLEHNLAIFSIGSDFGGWQYLNLADSGLSETGSTVYSLGSPWELTSSIAEGIISNARRELGEVVFLQFSAPISFGSGGGPLLNALGQVVGISSSSMSQGQQLNLAIPVNSLRELEVGDCVPLDAFWGE